MGTSNKQGNSVGFGEGQNPNTPSYSNPFISSAPYMPKQHGGINGVARDRPNPTAYNNQLPLPPAGLAYQNFLRQQQYPMQHLQQYASLLGLGPSTVTSSYSQPLGGEQHSLSAIQRAALTPPKFQQPPRFTQPLGGAGQFNQQPSQTPMSLQAALAQAPRNDFRLAAQSSRGIFNSQSPLEARGLGALPISSFMKAPQ